MGMKWGDEELKRPEVPVLRVPSLKGYVVFEASQLAWQLASLAESARNIGLEPPEIAVSGPAQLHDWIVELGSKHWP
jgi:hypothetical protein